jgi:hypothetical protein
MTHPYECGIDGTQATVCVGPPPLPPTGSNADLIGLAAAAVIIGACVHIYTRKRSQ